VYLACPSGAGGSRLDQGEDLKPSDASGRCSTCNARNCARTAVVFVSFLLGDAQHVKSQSVCVICQRCHGTNFTDRLPMIAAAVCSLAAESALIDGEAVAFRPDGHSDFAALRTMDLPGICGERFRFYAARPSN
jgi:hypothetical protein